MKESEYSVSLVFTYNLPHTLEILAKKKTVI